MLETIGQLGQGLGGLTLAASVEGAGKVPGIAALVPFLPLLGSALCGLFAVFKVRSKLPAWTSVGLLACSFLLVLMTYMSVGSAHHEGASAVVKAFDWINFTFWGGGGAGGAEGAAGGAAGGATLVGNFSFYVDSLTLLWMLFVTGLATLIALYASEYMSGDLGMGYCRFYAAFCLFVFSMACLVMGDNLLLLYLGWEGVGLCSYLLIGYFYKKPSAVAAAKKAFIMNRIGDLGLALGVMLTFVHFGTVEYAHLFDRVQETVAHGNVPFLVKLIPILLTVGAFGKSAQLFLYVWLPDAMEGPTPVSALIHAATMVTAGVYLVARLLPMYELSPLAIGLVAWGGTLTAFWAATIGMAQFDIKRIMAYSTVSQLGYMFAGLAVAGHSGVGGPSHVFTHAFFKALLFLACGAVMHGFAGQLDLRKLSGVQKMPGWKIVGITMLVGCLNLAGFPLITAGFWSKDIILADAFANPRFMAIGWILLITAGLTAYYTFRVYFRVFLGPKEYHPGDEHHAHADDPHAHHHAAGDAETAALAHESHANSSPTHRSAPPSGATKDHGHFHPHAPGWAINTVLAVLAIASFVAIPLVHSFTGPEGSHGWVGEMVQHSTAGQVLSVHADPTHHGLEHGGEVVVHGAPTHGSESRATTEHAGHAHATIFGYNPHDVMYYVSGVFGIGGILIAYWLHLAGRTHAATARADKLLPVFGPLARGAQNKWYVDEIYGFLFVTPLRVIAHIFHLIDKALVDGLVNLAGILPRGAGMAVRRTQTGVLHDYALRMVAGVAVVVVFVLILTGVFGGMDNTTDTEASTGETPVPRVQALLGEGVHP